MGKEIATFHKLHEEYVCVCACVCVRVCRGKMVGNGSKDNAGICNTNFMGGIQYKLQIPLNFRERKN